jgi:VIT1/CCC1 family predicted Fe2+/Mn2+ transporter
VKDSTSTKTLDPREADRLRTNLQTEVDGVALYRLLADANTQPELADVYRRLAEAEERHAHLWKIKLESAGYDVSSIRPSSKIRIVGWLAHRFGANTILPLVMGMESGDGSAYDKQSDASAVGMGKDERSHARIFRHIAHVNRTGLAGPSVAQVEGRHRTGGGNALRAGVLGSNDGLVSNLSLVMGVAGATLGRQEVLFTGLAGMLAGAISMALGEWLSVQSSRELYESQLLMEKAELEDIPDEELEELELIYQAKGLPQDQAHTLAAQIISDPTTALDTLAREELGIDPDTLGGSAWAAAVTSFVLFAVGAIVPVIPFMFTGGMTAVIISAVISGLGLFFIGSGITLFTGRNPLKSGMRQVIFGLAAALVTFGLGRVVGTGLGL